MLAAPACGRTARSLHSWLAFLAGDHNNINVRYCVQLNNSISNENPYPKRRPRYCVQWKSLKSTSQNPPTPDRRRPGKSTNQIPGRSTAAGRENQQSKQPRSASVGAVFVQFSPKVFDLYCTALHCTALHCTALHRTAPHRTALKSYVNLWRTIEIAKKFMAYH